MLTINAWVIIFLITKRLTHLRSLQSALNSILVRLRRNIKYTIKLRVPLTRLRKITHVLATHYDKYRPGVKSE